MNPVPNPFTDSANAETYSRYRPIYHDYPARRLRELLGDLDSVLDVACGTGHGTEALGRVFRAVRGCDISQAMLRVARRESRLEFVEGSASSLPASARSTSLVTVFMGFHWFDQPAFLSEAFRVLTPGGFLSIDNYGFAGEMLGSPEFTAANREFYSTNFPSPPRNRDSLPDEEMIAAGFAPHAQFQYSDELTFSLDQFVGFLATQSNLITNRRWTRDELELLLRRTYAHFFNKEKKTLKFWGWTRVYSKIG